VAYTYTGAAFAYAFNELFIVYIALLSLSGAALISGLSSIDVRRLRDGFDAQAPRPSVIAILLIMAVVLCLLWFSQIIPFYTHGTLPEMIVKAKTPTVFVHVLDLGVVVPLNVFSGFVLVKSATMGLALLSMTAFAIGADLEVDATLTLAWVALAGAGLAMSVWYFGHCRDSI